MDDPIPFNRPCLTGAEMQNIEHAVSSGHSSSGGSYTRVAEEVLKTWHGCDEVLLTTSCTDALEMAAMLIGIQPGDVVILPSFTFTSTALAFAREGARLEFCDIDPLTLGLDPTSVRSKMSSSVKAIVTVHYAGVPSSIDELVDIAQEFDVPLVEDNAHGLFATHNGKPLGTFGSLSTLSFHETKNFTCGEGGALVINDERLVDRAHVLLDKGANRRAFLAGQVDKYTWQDIGSSFGLSDLLAAFLSAQLLASDHVRTERRRVAQTYRFLLEPYVEELGIRLPFAPETATPADHMFYVLLPDAGKRSSVIEAMRAVGVHPAFHYVPLHSSPAGQRFSVRHSDCPVTDDVSARLLRLPFFNELSEVQIERVVASFVGALRTARHGD